MKLIREYIRKEFKRLSEDGMRSYPLPPEIRNALENNLKLNPLVRYVSTIKASATVPPSYRVFFNNNQTIDLYIEQIGIKAIIKQRSFWLDDVREANEAMALLNSEILTAPIPVSSEESEDEEGEDTGGDTGGGDDTEMEPEAEEEPEA